MSTFKTPTNGDLAAYKAIAAELNVSVAEVQLIEHRALAKFKRRLARFGITPSTFVRYLRRQDSSAEHVSTAELIEPTTYNHEPEDDTVVDLDEELIIDA